ncbi:MAG: hypothetical protein NTV73_10640 [Hyphomicrobiales bacterium]|nr:hypothetical protein [Hyphomicrobiales bacterium]
MRRAFGFAIVSLALMYAAEASDNRLVVPQISTGALVNLQSRQQRLDFQQRQQINREIDSLVTRQSQPRLDIPVMKPNCRPRQLGNSNMAQTC